jgi:selenocysteine lyase/cysteine desulfurase
MASPAVTPLFDPRDFRFPGDVVHVCAGGETPFLHRHDRAIAQYIEDKIAGSRGRVAQEAMVERVRSQVARLWHVETADIGWVGNVAEGVSTVLESIEWRDGDEVSVMPNEYPSLVAPLMARSRPAYRVRFAESASASALIECMTSNTRAVFVSHVSYLNGERFDLDAIRAAADAVGAMLIVDFTQASGYLPIHASIADFAFCASYKWMLGMTGVATAFWNRARRPRWSPQSAGWYSLAGANDLTSGIALRPDAMRFTRGNPAHISLYVLESALDYLSAFEPAAIQAHVQSLTSDLFARLSAHGVESSTPRETSRHGASVCLVRPDAKDIELRMGERGVLVWNGRGRIRISFHGYNCRREVDRVEEALMDAIR